MTDMDTKRARRQVMAGKVLVDLVNGHVAPVRAALVDRMVADETERLRVTSDQGDNYGTVSLSAKARAQVVDESAFLAWVAARRPDMIRQVVDATFQKAVLEAATAAGDPIDPHTGEVIPGVAIVQGRPYLVARPSTLARQAMADLVARNGLLELTD